MFNMKMTVIGGVAVVGLGVAAAVSLLGAASPKAETALGGNAPQIDMTIPDIDARSTGAGVTKAGLRKACTSRLGERCWAEGYEQGVSTYRALRHWQKKRNHFHANLRMQH